MVWSTTNHDAYHFSFPVVEHWSGLTRKLSRVVSVVDDTIPKEYQGVIVNTIAVKHNVLVLGGNKGELICKHLGKRRVDYSRVTDADFEFTRMVTAVEIYESMSGGVRFMASHHEYGVSEFDTERLKRLHQFKFPWAVNHTSISPDQRLIIAVGEHKDALLASITVPGRTVYTLVGHHDYSYASAWHPKGQLFATGNKDKTCRVWDVRNPLKAVAVLGCDVDAASSIRFSADGRFMVVAEGADLIHVYDVNDNFQRKQVIDLCGNICGVSLSPDDEVLFVAIHRPPYSCMLQFHRISQNPYLSSFF